MPVHLEVTPYVYLETLRMLYLGGEFSTASAFARRYKHEIWPQLSNEQFGTLFGMLEALDLFRRLNIRTAADFPTDFDDSER